MQTQDSSGRPNSFCFSENLEFIPRVANCHFSGAKFICKNFMAQKKLSDGTSELIIMDYVDQVISVQ